MTVLTRFPRARQSVKQQPTQGPKPLSLGGYLEGWKPGLVVVAAALLLTLLVVPRPVAPDVLPVPRVDRREQGRVREQEATRASSARRTQLPYEVRAVGESVRRYGSIASLGRKDGDAELRTLRNRVHDARQRSGNEPLLRLRALQTELFVQALDAWEATGEESQELRELGGDFLGQASREGFLGSRAHLDLSVEERRVVFRLRWNELTQLQKEDPFAPSLNEKRAYYRLLLEHPPAHLDTRGATLRDSKIVNALVSQDPEYPGLFARGVIASRLGRYAQAAEYFRQHLESRPDGPWRVRARNHLAAALARAEFTP